MSIWIDKNGRRHVGVMVAGRRIHRILPTNASASDAKRIEAEIRSSLGKKEPVIPGDPSMASIMGKYVTHASSLRSPKTAKIHARRCGPWTEGRKASEARQVASEIISDMRGEYANGTINRSLSALSKALRLAWERGETVDDYSRHVRRIPELNIRDVTLSLDEVRRIADKADDVVRASIWIAIYTGCRRGEILALRREDIGESDIIIRAGNTKSLKTRVIPITSPLRPWLSCVPLNISVNVFAKAFRRACKSAGLEHFRFHDLRRSCATMMVQAGVDLYVVSKLLGHSSVLITQARYAHLQTSAIRAALDQTFSPKIAQRRRKKLKLINNALNSKNK